MGRCIFVEREKNLEFLTRAGLSEVHVYEEVRNLSLSCYSSGPDKEHQEPYGDVWIFGCTVEAYKVYIKIVVRTFQENRPLLKILSFHEEERPLNFPFAIQ